MGFNSNKRNNNTIRGSTTLIVYLEKEAKLKLENNHLKRQLMQNSINNMQQEISNLEKGFIDTVKSLLKIEDIDFTKVFVNLDKDILEYKNDIDI